MAFIQILGETKDKLNRAYTRHAFVVDNGMFSDRPLSSLKMVSSNEEVVSSFMISDTNGIDTTTAHGKHLLNFFALIAEMERDFIASRVADGVALARSKGKQIGRAKTSKEKEQQIINLRKQNIGMLKIAKIVGVGSGTVQRVVKEQAALQVA